MSAEVKGLMMEEAAGRPITLLAKVEKSGPHAGEERGYELDEKAARLSKIVASALETDPSATEVALPEVGYEVLGYLVEYLQNHDGVEPDITEGPIEETDIKDVKTKNGKPFSPEDIDLINRVAKADMIYDFLTAASYMDINSAMNLARAKIVSTMKNGPVAEVTDRIASLAPQAKRKEIYAAAEAAAAEAKEAGAAETKGVAAATAGMAGLGLGESKTEQKRAASPRGPPPPPARAASPRGEQKRAASPVRTAAAPKAAAGAGSRTAAPPPPPATRRR